MELNIYIPKEELKNLNKILKNLENFGCIIKSSSLTENICDPLYNKIKKCILEVCGINIDANIFFSKYRRREYCYGRAIYAYHCREKGLSYFEIGKILKRSHSQAIYYMNFYKDNYSYNKEFKEVCDKFLNK